MSTRPLPVPPLVTLSTSAVPLPRPATWCRIARDAGVDGVDLDLSGQPLPRPGRLLATAERLDVPIRSIWVPRSGIWTGWRFEYGMAAAAALANATAANWLVIDAPAAVNGAFPLAMLTARTEALRARLTSPIGVVVAMRPRQLEGGRRHLVLMTALRRMAEEWEFDVALDLVGVIDPRWEAEAVVSRLGNRLRMIRVGSDVVREPGNGRNRASVRALAAAIDGGHLNRFAIVPKVSVWQMGHAAALARAGAAARQRITDRYSAVEEQRILDAFPHPWPGHRA